MNKLIIFLVVSLSCKSILKAEITELTNLAEKSIPDRKKEKDPTTPIIVANFFNIIANGILAAHSEHDKKARQQAIAAALASVNNILQLAFKSVPLSQEEQEKITTEIYKRLLRADILDEIEVVMETTDSTEPADEIE